MGGRRRGPAGSKPPAKPERLPDREGLWLQRYPNDVEALLLRLHKKGHVLRLEEGPTVEAIDQELREAPSDGQGGVQLPARMATATTTIKVLRTKRGKELGLELNPAEQRQIEELHAQLAHILRDDDAFRREVVRVHHRRMGEVYPLGTGCDLTPSHELLMRADKAGAAGKPFEFWVLVLGAARKGYEIVEETLGRPLAKASRR